MEKTSAFCVPGGAAGVSAWPPLPSADSGRGGAGAGRGSSWAGGAELTPGPRPDLVPGSSSAAPVLLRFKPRLWLKMCIFENHPY